MELAIEAQPPHDLPDADCRALCLRYAQLERKLGEVRASSSRGALLAGTACHSHLVVHVENDGKTKDLPVRVLKL
eukprot:1161160-Pelagomonas_calceolata.AAC.5